MPPLSGGGGAPARVVVVSVAGLTVPVVAPEGGPSPVPTIAALASAGASAGEVESSCPASARPAAATLLTGRTPSHHGVGGEWWRDVGQGIAPAPLTQVPSPSEPTLLSAAAARGVPVASLGWPGVRAGAAIFQPETGLASPAGGALAVEGPERDAWLADAACAALAAKSPPRLVLLRLAQTAPAARRFGPESAELRAAWARVDADVAHVVDCAAADGGMDRTAVLVVGDHAFRDWTATIEPNVALARAGLVTPLTPGTSILSWTAVARSSGGSAFVYAKSESDALLARKALEQVAASTPGFRIVSADEMLRCGADAEAWFGLEADPGYAFGVAAAGALSHGAAERGVAGYLASKPSPAFVAYGRGVKSRTRIARMRQVDVAPTVASLLGLPFQAAEGRAVASALEPAAAPATDGASR